MNSSNSSSSEATPWNPCPSTSYGLKMFFVVEAINFIVGFPVNVWTVWSVAKGSGSIQASEVFTLNLALLESVYGFLSFLRPLNFFVIRSGVLYDFNVVLYGLLSSGRPLFQAAMCVERYVGVVHPVVYLRLNSVRTRLFALPLLWTSALVFSVSLRKLIFIFPVVFLLLLLLQVYCCVRILQVLRRRRPGDGNKTPLDPVKRKAFVTVLVTQVVMVLNYLPAVVAVPLRGRLSRHVYLCQLVPAVLSFSVFGSFVQPLMYVMRRRTTPRQHG